MRTYASLVYLGYYSKTNKKRGHRPVFILLLQQELFSKFRLLFHTDCIFVVKIQIYIVSRLLKVRLAIKRLEKKIIPILLLTNKFTLYRKVLS